MHPTRHPRSSRYCSSRSDAAGTHTSFRLSIQHRSPSFIRFLHFSLSYCFFYCFSVFLIFTRLFHIFFFFIIIITFGCYNRRYSSSFTGPSFSPTTRYPVFTNGASDSTTDQSDAARSAPVLPTLPITLVASMPPIPANSDDIYTRQTLGSMTLPNNTEVHVIKAIACLKVAHAILMERIEKTLSL